MWITRFCGSRVSSCTGHCLGVLSTSRRLLVPVSPTWGVGESSPAVLVCTAVAATEASALCPCMAVAAVMSC